MALGPCHDDGLVPVHEVKPYFCCPPFKVVKPPNQTPLQQAKPSANNSAMFACVSKKTEMREMLRLNIMILFGRFSEKKQMWTHDTERQRLQMWSQVGLRHPNGICSVWLGPLYCQTGHLTHLTAAVRAKVISLVPRLKRPRATSMGEIDYRLRRWGRERKRYHKSRPFHPAVTRLPGPTGCC